MKVLNMTREQMLAQAKPILFSTPMVQAIRREIDPKQMTRRVVTLPNWAEGEIEQGTDDNLMAICSKTGCHAVIKPRCKVGDILYVRETWGCYALDKPESNADYLMFRADYPDGAKTYEYPGLDDYGEKIICDLPKWRPSLFMPKAAARTFLHVAAVRAERLQDITEEDALREGCEAQHYTDGAEIADDPIEFDIPARIDFICLWELLNAKRGYGWDTNPWVWVYTFERVAAADERLTA